MSKIRRLLFPFRQTFLRLELEKLWWHRLAIVLLFVTLLPIFLYSWVIGDDANGAVQSFGAAIQYWEVLPQPPNGTTIEQTVDPVTLPPDTSSIGHGKVAVPLKDIFDAVAANVNESDMRKTIEMPDGKIMTYSGMISDEVIRTEWKHKLKIVTAKAAAIGFGIAILVAGVCSFLLQTSYRLLLYVIYGANPTET